MKKITFLFACIACISFAGFAQTIPNSGFENWTDSVTPTDWNSLKVELGFVNVYTAHQTTDVQAGTYALKVTNENAMIQNVMGVVTLGTIDLISQSVSGGIPFTATPSNLTGYYKFQPAGTDSMAIFGYLTHWNGSGIDTVGGGIFSNNTPVATYTAFDIPFDYNQGIGPDTLNIVIMSASSATITLGTALYVDELAFVFNPVGISIPVDDMFGMNLYPNPAIDHVVVEFNDAVENGKIEIVNINGDVVYGEKLSGKTARINTSDWANGVYVVRVEGTRARKFTINR